MATQWRIELLGGPRAVRVDRVIARFQTQKIGSLLAYLAYYPQRPHQRETLIELLWPEGEAHAGRNNLSVSLSWLRRQLEPPGVPAGTVLIADRATVRLNPEAITTDVAEFDAALRAAKHAGSSAEQTECLARAVELVPGELLPGHFDDWVLQERQWLAERYFQALEQLLAHLERASEFDRALDYARRGVSADPLREEAHRDLIRLLAAVGQPSAALRQYQELERLLKEQLEAVPEAATRALVREIERLALLRPAGVPAFRRSGVGEGTLALPERLNARTPEPLTPEGENRLVTLLFADMSRSMETTRDLHPEEGAALVNRLLQAMVDVVLKYEGRIDRFQGDGLLAVFGVPHAHEEDPERAIRAAMEIRAAAHHLDLEVTAGINTGEVYVGVVGSERHQEMTVMGPAVGLAARLQEQAQPGQILVGEVTQRLTRRAFAFTPRTLGLKGLARPTTVYAVEQALMRPEKARGIEGLRAELIGRDAELAKLKAALAAVLQGQSQVVTLIGEAGVGKSRLVAELKAAVNQPQTDSNRDGQDRQDQAGKKTPAHPVTPSPLWLEGRCLELTMTAGYSLFVDLLRDYFAWRPEEEEQARGERLAACLRGLGEQGELSQEQAEEMGPLLGHLLSLRFGTAWDARLKNAAPEQIRHQSFLAVRDFLVALARRQPLVLVLEDLHWADTLSLDLISLLLESLPLAPLCLLCVYRPEREHKCWHLATLAARKCPGCCTEIPLRELTPEQSRRLVESLLTIENLPASVKELILEKSRGNPFFVEEVVRSLIAAGMVYREGELWRAREEIETFSVPESIQSVIASRVDRLRPQLQQVLQSAAVIGRLFRPRLLEAVAGVQEALPERLNARTPERLNACLWELEELDLVYQERVVPEEEYSFKHVLTQETIYQSILRRQRPLLHQQVGEAIEALYQEGLVEHYEPLAYHYERSKADEKAVEYLLKAGEKARRAYLNMEAIGYFERALERLEGQGDRAEETGAPSSSTIHQQAPTRARLAAVKGLGLVYFDGLGNASAAEGYFRQAIALGHEIGLTPRELVGLYHWLAEAMFWLGRHHETRRIGEEGLALLGDDLESAEAVWMNAHIAGGFSARTDGWEKVREFTLRNLPLLERLPYSEELRPAYVSLASLRHSEKNAAEAIHWFQTLERRAAQHHDLKTVAEAACHIGRILATTGDLPGGIQRLQQCAQLLAKIGDAKIGYQCAELLARTFLSLGCLQQAEEYASRWLELWQAARARFGIARGYCVIGAISLCEASWSEAAERFQRAAQWAREMGNQGEEALADHLRGRVDLAQGKPQEAVTRFQEALALLASNPLLLAGSLPRHLSALEAAYGDSEAFRAFCRRFREEHPEIDAASFVQWYLEPAQPRAFSQRLLHDALTATLSPDWHWHDPFGDCSFTVRSGLEIQAANGRDLWATNHSAPRLLRPASGEFAAQTVCLPASDEKPAMGGILLWKDKENFLRLDRGTGGQHESCFQGCLGNKDVIIGRGRLPSERILLRLERLGRRVNALCSSDGESWFTVGHAEFAVKDPVEVGLHAIGSIDRTLYHGAYPEGTAIQFECFEIFQ